MCCGLPTHPMKPRTRDSLIYLSVGLGIVAAVAIHMFYTERVTGTIQPIPMPILWGIVSTPGIVALILGQFWNQRRRPMLWAILTVVAAINVSVVAAAYCWRWNPPLIVWSLITGGLIVPVFVAADKLLASR